jgi:adenosylmethionine-8-amino-7-oxononanoate aminotransferase
MGEVVRRAMPPYMISGEELERVTDAMAVALDAMASSA